MNIPLIDSLSRIQNDNFTRIIPQFLAKVFRSLDLLNVKNYSGISDGIEKYLISVNRDQLFQIIGILLIAFLDQQRFQRDLLLLELEKLRSNISQVEIIDSSIFYLKNSYDILSTHDYELNTHRTKLILLEKISKFISNQECANRVIDLIFLVGT